MKHICTLIAAKDLEKSKEFYHNILEQTVVNDLGANVTLSGGFALQSLASWQEFIQKNNNDIVFGSNSAELVFEIDDMDAFLSKLNSFDVAYVHPVKEHAWGQRVVRFYDPDQHIIEVGENMTVVVKRFIESGLTTEQTSKRMGIPVEAVSYLLAQGNE